MKETRSGRLAASFRAHLMSLATAVPSHCVHQSTVAAVANDLFAHRFPGYARLARVFETSDIKTRHMIKPLDWYQSQLGWPQRMAADCEGA
jgi:alkylresorcinol/alkylpyrone synthase